MGFGLSILIDLQVINVAASDARGGEHEKEEEARIQRLRLRGATRWGDQKKHRRRVRRGVGLQGADPAAVAGGGCVLRVSRDKGNYPCCNAGGR